MRLYPRTHELSCGIDLHARTMYVCVLDREGRPLLHRNLPCRPEALLSALAPFRDRDLAVACECLFAWYWLADLCDREGIPFALGHALGMRSIHGLKTKSDRLDSWKIAQLLRGGNLPCAYVYPRRFRATRDLLHAEATATLRRREVLSRGLIDSGGAPASSSSKKSRFRSELQKDRTRRKPWEKSSPRPVQESQGRTARRVEETPAPPPFPSFDFSDAAPPPSPPLTDPPRSTIRPDGMRARTSF